MEIAIQALLALLTQVLPLLSSSSVIQPYVDALVKIVPVILTFAPQFTADVKSVIAILEANPETLPEQVAAVKAQIPQDDAAFDDAAAQAEASDAAADAAKQ